MTPGTRLGPYEILEPLGSGGMGEVYSARDTRLGRKVAIKVVASALAADPDRIARFEREARAAALLNHPNICYVFDVGVHDSIPFIVSELLEGETLRVACADGPISIRRAVDYACQVARGLAAAHERGIVHRDLKPDNLFITTDGRVKILDFGVAKLISETAADADTRLAADKETRDGVILGTPGYMSPEQLRGHPADARSDIFSFGTVLFEMLAGKRPFVGDTAADTSSAILKDDPPPLPVERGIGLVLDRVVRRCLAKAPRDRFQSADDLAFALDAVTMPVTSAVAVSDIPRPRRRARMAIATLSAVAAVALVLVSADSLGRPAVDLSTYRFVPFATEAQTAGEPAWSPDGRSIAYSQTVGARDELIVQSLDNRPAIQLTHPPLPAPAKGTPFWWPDSSRIGFISSDVAVSSINAAGGAAESIQRGNAIITAAALSPDGKTLAMWRVVKDKDGTSGSVWLASPPRATPRMYMPAPFIVKAAVGPDALGFSRDGRQLLLGEATIDGKLALWVLPLPDGNGAKPRLLPVKGLLYGIHPRFSWMPDNRHAVVSIATSATPRGGLWIVDTSSGDATLLTSGFSAANGPTLSPDGQRVAFTAGQVDFNIVEIPLDGRGVHPLLATTSNETAAAWAPDGRQFVYVTDRSGSQELRLRDLEGRDRVVVGSDVIGRGLIGAPTVSPDGQRVAYSVVGSGDAVNTWVAPIGGGVPVKLDQATTFEAAPEWSPDGTAIALFREEKGAFALAIATLGATGPPRTIDMPPIPGVPAWSPDGAWLAYFTDSDVRLVSPDGMRKRTVATLNAYAVAWNRDSTTLYAAVRKEVDGTWTIQSIDVASGVTRILNSLPPQVLLDTPITPSLRLTLSKDGKRLLTTAVEQHFEIWILDHFVPRGWTEWFRRPRL